MEDFSERRRSVGEAIFLFNKADFDKGRERGFHERFFSNFERLVESFWMV